MSARTIGGMGSTRRSDASRVRNVAAATAAPLRVPQSRNGVIGAIGQRAPITA